MSVAYVHNDTIPNRKAHTIHVAKMCQAFIQEGYSTTLFGYRGLQLVDLPRHYGLEVVVPLVQFQPHPWLRGHDFAWRAAWMIKRRGYALVYARALTTALWTTVLGIPTIVEEHQPPGSRMGQVYLHIVLRQRAFCGLVVIHEVLRERFLQHYRRVLRPEQVIVEPDAIDLERFEQLPTSVDARHLLGWDTAAFTVGYAGHLYAGRGIDLILGLAHRLPTMRFVLMGGEEADLAYWRAQAIPPNVNFTGFIPNADLPLYLAACDVLLMPYQRHVSVAGTPHSTHAWMSPLKLFEYMAAQRLIIASDLPALRTLLNPTNAVLCPPEDSACWEAALQRAADQSAWARQLAAQARQDVTPYTWRQRVQRIMGQLA